MSTTTYRDLLPVAIEEAGVLLPDGFDSWGIKSIHPDLRTTHNYRWAPPGGLNSRPGDGLCVATTWRGMASGGIPARTLLLVAYRAADVVGRDDAGVLRLAEVASVASLALVDGERLVREHGERANLRDACLRGANLQDAYLWCADLWGASLRYAQLRGADLQRANLQGADLWGADLRCADLQGADLRYANLRDADLRNADLQGVNLQYADLQGARWTIGATPPSGWTLTDAGTLTRAGGVA